MDPSQDSDRGIFGRNKLLNLFLKTTTTLINSSKTDFTDKTPSELIQKMLPIFSKTLKTNPNHKLAETIFRLSINTPIPINLDSNEVKSTIFGVQNKKFDDFFLNYWGKSPILLKKGSINSEENNPIFTSLSNKWRNSDSITDEILQDLISCPPISSDKLNINNFLTELTPHSFIPQLITNQDIKIVKTEGPKRKTEIPHSSTPQLITNQDIKIVKTEGPNCKIIKTEGPNRKTETHSSTPQLTNIKILKNEGPNRKTEIHYPIIQDYSTQASKQAFNDEGTRSPSKQNGMDLHVALHCWYKKLKQNSDNFFLNSKFENPNLTFTLLSHITIKFIGNHDSTFRKACLVASNYQIPSEKSIFDQIFSKIDEKSNFLEAFNWIKLVCEKRDEDPLQCLRWLRHLDQNEIIICNLLENLEKYVVPCGGNMDEAKEEFDNFKGCFCKYVVYEDVCVGFGNLLEKYRKVRGQYMKGMLGLHRRY